MLGLSRPCEAAVGVDGGVAVVGKAGQGGSLQTVGQRVLVGAAAVEAVLVLVTRRGIHSRRDPRCLHEALHGHMFRSTRTGFGCECIALLKSVHIEIEWDDSACFVGDSESDWDSLVLSYATVSQVIMTAHVFESSCTDRASVLRMVCPSYRLLRRVCCHRRYSL